MQAGSEPKIETQKTSQLELARMRCPSCNRLFSVEFESLNGLALAGATRAEFGCSQKTCQQVFAVKLPLTRSEIESPVLPTFALMKAVESARPDQDRAQGRSSLSAGAAMPMKTRSDRGPSGPSGRSKPESVSARNSVSFKSALSSDLELLESTQTQTSQKECSRCNTVQSALSKECVRCGVVFDFMSDVDIEEELSLGGSKELFAAWNLVIEDYEDRIRHERFLELCRRDQALSYAAKKYAQILVAAPQDLTARQMRNKIVALVSSQAENSKIPTHLNLRIPKLNQLALFLASLLFFVGLMVPSLDRLMHLGFAMIVLTLSVRFMMRAEIN